MLFQMLSIGAEMKNSLQKIRQREGIQPAKLKNVYKGRMKGACASASA
jgi:DNA invertase Pin-like site-specific DNA recombinase